MTMKSLNAVANTLEVALPPRFTEKLPVGLRITCWKMSANQLELSIPAEENGLLLTFINYKGDLQIASAGSKDGFQQASPGLGLLTQAAQPLLFRSFEPVQFSAVSLFISADWIRALLKTNPNFTKIEQALEGEGSILTCRLGRRQLTLFAAITGYSHREGSEDSGSLLEIQNHALCLLEHFLCSRHRNLAGVNASTGIDNEDDLSLIREVESYISEYYCSDTFTVDAILKKTYTSYHKLNFLFKSMHGMTISEYIRNKRIEKSREMIADNVKSISQIAYEIGYSSISNYILAFKKIYRITPGKYKKQMDNLA
ncbi:MAG: helix-turn-helix transcriptional regulator [Chitinophagaceae bacterium]|nr:helix-turn-helix transcriptional regulator [Chitinophagaceae bacterium]